MIHYATYDLHQRKVIACGTDVGTVAADPLGILTRDQARITCRPCREALGLVLPSPWDDLRDGLATLRNVVIGALVHVFERGRR